MKGQTLSNKQDIDLGAAVGGFVARGLHPSVGTDGFIRFPATDFSKLYDLLLEAASKGGTYPRGLWENGQPWQLQLTDDNPSFEVFQKVLHNRARKIGRKVRTKRLDQDGIEFQCYDG